MLDANNPTLRLVFRLPKAVSKEFCFNGGHATNFQLVDWFHDQPQYDISQEEKIEFLKQKNYRKSDDHLLVMSGDGTVCFVVPADGFEPVKGDLVHHTDFSKFFRKE